MVAVSFISDLYPAMPEASVALHENSQSASGYQTAATGCVDEVSVSTVGGVASLVMKSSVGASVRAPVR